MADLLNMGCNCCNPCGACELPFSQFRLVITFNETASTLEAVFPLANATDWEIVAALPTGTGLAGVAADYDICRRFIEADEDSAEICYREPQGLVNIDAVYTMSCDYRVGMTPLGTLDVTETWEGDIVTNMVRKFRYYKDDFYYPNVVAGTTNGGGPMTIHWIRRKSDGQQYLFAQAPIVVLSMCQRVLIATLDYEQVGNCSYSETVSHGYVFGEFDCDFESEIDFNEVPGYLIEWTHKVCSSLISVSDCADWAEVERDFDVDCPEQNTPVVSDISNCDSSHTTFDNGICPNLSRNRGLNGCPFTVENCTGDVEAHREWEPIDPADAATVNFGTYTWYADP